MVIGQRIKINESYNKKINNNNNNNNNNDV